MNYTENYHLPQWVKSDRIMMEDFNQMCRDLEQGITSTAHALEVQIGSAKTAAAAAQSTANTARSEAAAAAVLPYVIGSYTGNGAATREITVGFQPRFVIICGKQLVQHMENSGYGLAMAGPTIDARRITMTATGFLLDISNTQYDYPKVNENNASYDYIAFR